MDVILKGKGGGREEESHPVTAGVASFLPL